MSQFTSLRIKSSSKIFRKFLCFNMRTSNWICGNVQVMKSFKGMRENFPFILERLYMTSHYTQQVHFYLFLSVFLAVVFLAQKLLGERRHIFVDCWNVSSRPALFLFQSNTYITGTVRINKEVLRRYIDEDLNKGSSIFIRNEDMLLVRFLAKKNVYVLTTLTRLH